MNKSTPSSRTDTNAARISFASRGCCALQKDKKCLECGDIFSINQIGQNYCSIKCRKVFNNRQAIRGAKLYALAMSWRKYRRKEDLSNLCHQIGIYLRADTEAERLSWVHTDTPQYDIPKNQTTKAKD